MTFLKEIILLLSSACWPGFYINFFPLNLVA